MVVVKVRRVGNSNVVSLPRELEKCGFTPGTPVVIDELPGGEVILRRVNAVRSSLQSGPGDLHAGPEATDSTGKQVGPLALRRAAALRILEEHRAEIKALGIDRLVIFGSVARDEARPDSDIDVLVEVGRPLGHFELFEAQEYLEGLLGHKVDLFTPGALRPAALERAVREGIRVA